MTTDGPLIVQSDKTLLLEVDHPMAAECRQAIAPFAELERSPEHVHTYRLTPLGMRFVEPVELLYVWGRENPDALDQLGTRPTSRRS